MMGPAAIRFQVQPRLIPAAKAARRLFLTVDDFRRLRFWFCIPAWQNPVQQMNRTAEMSYLTRQELKQQRERTERWRTKRRARKLPETRHVDTAIAHWLGWMVSEGRIAAPAIDKIVNIAGIYLEARRFDRDGSEGLVLDRIEKLAGKSVIQDAIERNTVTAVKTERPRYLHKHGDGGQAERRDAHRSEGEQ